MKIHETTSENEKNIRKKFLDDFKETPIPDNEILDNLGLFINRQNLSRILFIHELFQKIINVNGVIMEFGIRWGQNLSLFQSLRGIYEPFNHNRKIIGFDTFSGFPSIDQKDGRAEIISEGSFSVSPNYKEYLERIMTYHEKESPISHIKKYELVEGNAISTLKKYLQNNPETIVALAYFDFDIYEPTKKCLELIIPHLTKGSIVGFDELNHHVFPGETQALKEVFGISKYKIIRSPFSSTSSYMIIE